MGFAENPLHQFQMKMFTIFIALWGKVRYHIFGHLVAVFQPSIANFVDHFEILLVGEGQYFLVYNFATDPSPLRMLAVNHLPYFQILLLYLKIILFAEWKVVFNKTTKIQAQLKCINSIILPELQSL